MATARQAVRRYGTARPWWRPAAYSAAATAAIAALFNPIPAFADPGAAAAPMAPIAVPDVGSRPMALGTLVMPGQTASTTTTASATIAGAANSPVLQKIEKGRAEIATMGDQLIQLGTDRDLAKTQETTAEQKYEQAVDLMQQARAEAASAAAQSMMEAAALPPGSFSGLAGLDDLARLQRGDAGSSQAAARQLETAETTVQLALDENSMAKGHYDSLVNKYNALNKQLTKKQAAQQTLELAHADELSAAEASESAADSALGAQYLAGAEAGRGADARALQALQFALAQRGDPYVWSEEGPDEYDCSGLMYAAYHSVGFPLDRVSRDQYWQTHLKVVDRYSLLPGDLLFFSYSNSWRGIHHVAMYAGEGMMVEAPRTGLTVRLTPVRWSRLFQATRVFGSVPGLTEGPVLGEPDPDPETDTTTPDNTTPPTNPTSGTPRPSTSTTQPSSHPTTPTTSPSTTKPTTSPTTTEPTTTPPTTTPTTTTPTTTPTSAEVTSEPTGSQTTQPSAGGSGDSNSPATSSTGSANATEQSTQSASASSGSGSSSATSSAG